MTQEAKRCALALDLARAGKTAAHGLLGRQRHLRHGGARVRAARRERRAGDRGRPRPDGGVQRRGALLGAPLTHDFAVISLSDRLTPWETIEKRLTARGKGRPDHRPLQPREPFGGPQHLKRACDILLRVPAGQSPLRHRAQHRPRGESWRTLTLGELREAEVDMFCTVIVGNVSTKEIAGRLITPRGYKNV